MKVSLFFTEFEAQPLAITVPNDFKDSVSLEKSLSDLTQNTTPSVAVENYLKGANALLKDEMETQEASDKPSSSVEIVSHTHQKNKLLNVILQSLQKIQNLKGPYIFTLQCYAS